MTDLSPLIERVKALSGASREVDWLIYRALHPNNETIKKWEAQIAEWSATEAVEWASKFVDLPAFTSDLNAILRLVEEKLPGRDIILEIGNVGPDKVTDAEISGADGYFEEPKSPPARGYAPTPALALLAALLSALQSQTEQDSSNG